MAGNMFHNARLNDELRKRLNEIALLQRYQENVFSSMTNLLITTDENGEYDFESLGALDVPLFNQHLLALMNGEEVQFPRFNFHTGQREPGETVRLGPDHIIIVEGIHGLNPKLVPRLLFPRSASTTSTFRR